MVRPLQQQLPLRSSFKLWPYDEEETAFWFLLIKAQFSAVGIKSQNLKYANALASLPKQVLRDILDTVDVCNDSYQPFELLKDVLLGQFGKSKWQSYLNCFGSPWKCKVPSPAFSWENSSSISLMESVRTQIFFSPCC
jgi:hypothetical protein